MRFLIYDKETHKKYQNGKDKKRNCTQIPHTQSITICSPSLTWELVKQKKGNGDTKPATVKRPNIELCVIYDKKGKIGKVSAPPIPAAPHRV